ncbi:MAG: radical SAM protein [Planctomycetes bacterium]|nr:radical SAM protein [Planctomycetota bacterium]
MELTARKGEDIFAPAGAFRRMRQRLRQHRANLGDLSAVVFACWDPRIRKLPFVIYDRYIFPAGPRSIAGTLHDAGITSTRCVYQLWNPRFRPSRARLDGRIPDMLLLSAMGHSSSQAYAMIADAWQLGEQRPLILVGGPKAIYQPYDYWPVPTPHGNVGPDAVITGEAYVLVDLLNVLAEHRRPGEPIRAAFERARHAGALDDVPGLVYLAPDATIQEPRLIDTGLQRLVQSFDEFPDEAVNLCLLEPPHRGTGLSAAPIPARSVGRHVRIASIQLTQGCKFSCSYCPIPAVNQKTWRFRRPEGVVAQMRDLYDRFHIRYMIGTDDNFMNKRQTAEEMLEALARATTSKGRALGQRIRWATEATQFDTYKNQDLLPLARRAGLNAIWFGIEDLTAELINKGQKPEKTLELFRLMHANNIAPMAMIMYHDGQPFDSPNSLYGLSNQVKFLRDAGAISLQCTVHSPGVGTKEWENTFANPGVLAEVGGLKIGDRHHDGNYVIVKGRESHLARQLKWLGGYWSFYNPINLLKAMRKDGSPLRKVRVGYQIVGMFAALWTTFKTVPFLVRLLRGKPRYHAAVPAAVPLPVELAPNAFPRYPTAAPLPRRTQKTNRAA